MSAKIVILDMSDSKLFIILVIVAISVPSILATEFKVGDATGWTLNFDYQKWAEGKEFRVGDKLSKLITL